MKCLNIIVYYNNLGEIKEYISEISSVSIYLVDVLIVVNSDNGLELDELKEWLDDRSYDFVKILDYHTNIGYLNAMLKPIREIDYTSYKYVILSNTDIHYMDDTFFEDLMKKEYNNDIGCIAPDVISGVNGSHSNPHYISRISKEKYVRLIKIFSYPRLGKIYLKLSNIKNKYNKKKYNTSCYVYSPHGCYMIFASEFINKIKGYEYGVKLYSEESAVGELLQRNGMKCYYDDSLHVVHDESSVTGKMNYKKRFADWKASLEYIVDEFY